MRISSLKITNFRGFVNKSFEFDPQMTVVVGNNTTGKTTLLKAVQIALGAYLKSLKSLPSSDRAYSMNFALKDVFRKYNAEKKTFILIRIIHASRPWAFFLHLNIMEVNISLFLNKCLVARTSRHQNHSFDRMRRTTHLSCKRHGDKALIR